MSLITKVIYGLVRRGGYDVVRYFGEQPGADPFIDMRRLLDGQTEPLVLDVGANVGQSVDRFRQAFPTCSVHSFEPSPSTYEKLRAHCENLARVRTWNLGVGAANATLTFQENEFSAMSSFLMPGETGWGRVVRSTEVPVITLDSFAKDQNIDFIHVLKSDTQGYDFEVFKGAKQLMAANCIGLIYYEVIFSEQYKHLPSFHDVFGYLLEQDFALVTFYDMFFQKGLVSWTDALFVNREFYRRMIKRGQRPDIVSRRLSGHARV